MTATFVRSLWNLYPTFAVSRRPTSEIRVIPPAPSMTDYKESSLPDYNTTSASLSRTETPIPGTTMNDSKHLTPTISPDSESLHHDAKTGFVANTLAQDAQEATTKEQNMTLREGLRMYPKAIFWSVIISTCIAMEGYDLCLLGNFCE